MKNDDSFHLLGGFSAVKSSKMLSWVSLEGEPGPAPRLHYCVSTVPPLSLHPFPSLIGNCLHLPFGSQGRSRRLKSVSYKQEMGDRKASMPRNPTGSWLSFSNPEQW